MVAQHHDRHREQDRDHTPRRLPEPRRYSAVVPAHCLDERGCLIDELIQFVFDTLGVQHLDLRVSTKPNNREPLWALCAPQRSRTWTLAGSSTTRTCLPCGCGWRTWATAARNGAANSSTY